MSNSDILSNPSLDTPSAVSYSRLRNLLMWIVALSFVLFQFTIQLSSGVLIKDMMHSFSITALGAAFLSSSFYYAYVSLQIPIGVLIDRFGVRRLLTIGALICAVGCWLLSFTHLFYAAEFARLLTGIGASVAFVGLLSVINARFPARHFALMLGLAETIGMTGTMTANMFLANYVQHAGWRTCMFASMLIAIVIAIVIWIVVRDRPNRELGNNYKQYSSIFQSLKQIMSHASNWANGIYCGIMFSVITVFVALWGIPFLAVQHHYSNPKAAVICSLLLVGVSIGCPVLGRLYPTIDNKRLFLTMSAWTCALLCGAIIYLPMLSTTTLIVLLILLGFCCSTYVWNFTIANEVATESTKSTMTGFINTLTMIIAPILQPLIGGLLVIFAHHHAGGGMSYNLSDYRFALSIMPLTLFFAGCLTWLF